MVFQFIGNPTFSNKYLQVEGVSEKRHFLSVITLSIRLLR